VRRAVLLRDGVGLTDRQLLADYLNRRDEAALAALVRRHGPLVWGTCRRVLRNYHDAEDAFQATFLVLVRKAAALASRELLANWLYGVAHQTALNARARSAKRRTRERQVPEMPEPEAVAQALWHDLRPLLDQELSRLPDKYRIPIVLCDLEGVTRKEAARQLGVPDGTVAGWLARARTRLAKRLARRGLVLSGGSLAVVLSQNVASACVPTSVVASTIKAAGLFAAGQAAAAGAISVEVAALTEGVLKTMLLTKLKTATLVLLAATLLGTGAGWLTHQALAEKPTDQAVKDAGTKDRTDVSGVVKAVDASQHTVTLHPGKEFPDWPSRK
jgi:RNA polymerase sigma factor (sigma-70 family)